MPLPLEGVRVLDLTHGYGGPTGTRILADLGADAVRVEDLARIDAARLLLMADGAPGSEPWNQGAYHALRNPGKRSLAVELSSKAGQALLWRLMPQFDVLAESFAPGVRREMGFDYEAVRARRPDIVMISLSDHGQSGPHSDSEAAGVGLEPAPGLSSTDPLCGMIAAGAVLTALRYRRRTGRGQHIDLFRQEATMGVVSGALVDYQINGRLPDPVSNRGAFATPQGCYRCQGDDDWLVISVANDAEWSALCVATGHPEWREDERFATILDRQANHDALDALIEGWTATQDHVQAMHVLQAGGVTAAAVINGKEMLLDPHLKARGQFDLLDHPTQGRRPIPRTLVAKFGRFDPGPRSAAPLLGQHNREVLIEAGLSEAEVYELETAGIIGTRPRLAASGRAGSGRLSALEDLLEVGALRARETDYKEQLGIGGRP